MKNTRGLAWLYFNGKSEFEQLKQFILYKILKMLYTPAMSQAVWVLRKDQPSTLARKGTMSLLIIATSLDPDSRSQKLARTLLDLAQARQIKSEVLDLRELELPMAGSEASWKHPNALALKAQLQKYKRFIFALPVYNYDVNAAAKNLLELAGGSLEGSVAGLVCSAGGKASYMAPLGFMNSLMLDFRVWVAPRYVYATEPDWRGDTVSSELKKRLMALLEDVTLGLPHAA